jgi:hypothetical protein
MRGGYVGHGETYVDGREELGDSAGPVHRAAARSPVAGAADHAERPPGLRASTVSVARKCSATAVNAALGSHCMSG